jgi:hypothetical protein
MSNGGSDEHVESAGGPEAIMGCLGMILLPVAILAKLVIMPFERPIRRSSADVARILRNLLDGTVSPTEWDDFVCIPIADKRLDEIRKRCADLHDEFRAAVRWEDMSLADRVLLRSYISAEGQQVVRSYVRELEGAA